MKRSLRKSLYFTLESPEDVRLLELVLALPPSRQNRILKAALKDALPRYLKRHLPNVVPLSPEAVEAAIKLTKRRVYRGSSVPHPWPIDKALSPSVPTSPSGDDGQRLPPTESVSEAPSQPSGARDPQEAERKLDRLLRTLAK